MSPKTLTLFLVFLSSLAPLILALAPSSLPLGSSLSVEHARKPFLTSLDQTFSCGFHSLGPETNNAPFYFSVWFTNSNETVVWTANRDRPVNRRGSRVALRGDGGLVLTDFDGSTVWKTNTTATNATRLELQDSGNLVLKDSSGKAVLWQSFDFPTDTLLPNQTFSRNTRLVSRISPKVLAPGYFSMYFDSDTVLKIIYDGPEISSIYWPGPDTSNVFRYGRTTYNSSMIAILEDNGVFTSSDNLTSRASDAGGPGVKRRLTVDHDGNLRLYSLDEPSGSWLVTWQGVRRPCEMHGLCGRNGVCVYEPKPTCTCPPYYEPANSTDWSQGCKPGFEKRWSNADRFIKMSHVDYYGYDLNYTYGEHVSADYCRGLCLGDPRCEAYGYRNDGEAICYTKGALFNGYRSNDFLGDIFLRVPKAIYTALSSTSLIKINLTCPAGGPPPLNILPVKYVANDRKFKWIYVYAPLLTIGAIELVILVAGWWFLFRRHGVSSSLEDGYLAISSQFWSFSYGELKRATREFKEMLGKGGFGTVYKGVLGDERVIAVKKLVNVVQGDEEFWAEVNTIGRINHMNLTRMWGFCSEGKRRLLVYEFMENGSLDKHLFSPLGDEVLGWKERFKIALGTAKGLAYLHHECLEWVIHCDVKPENLLLDEDFEPKISDFGLAKLYQRAGHDESSKTSKIRGTKGYMAPEWIRNLPLTAKVDVYSYGIVILELVRGVRSSDLIEGTMDQTSIVTFAKKGIETGEGSAWVEEVVDQRLEGNFSRNQAAIMIEVGISCIEEDRNKRPTMESVVQILAQCEDETATHAADRM